MTLFLALACKTDPAPDTGTSATDDTGPTPTGLVVRECGVLRYEAADSAQVVFVAGSWNDWDSDADEMEQVEDGLFEIQLDLSPGVYPYKFVEKTGEHRWVCDREAELVHCDAGYDADQWNDCSPGASACNSLLVVEDCSQPAIAVDIVDIDREGMGIEVTAHFEAASSEAELASVEVLLDGDLVD